MNIWATPGFAHVYLGWHPDISFMFGVSTFCLHKEPLPAALDTLSRITDFIEVMDEGRHHLDNVEILKSYTTKFSLHAPSRGTNLASLLESIRKASVEVMAGCFSIAAEVNAGIVVHPGYFAWEEERDKAENQLRKSLEDLDRHVREYSVDFLSRTWATGNIFCLKPRGELPLIGSSKFALDVGHAHQNHCLNEFLRHPVAHYHLHDNDGTEDSHAAIGEGTIDFSMVMAEVRKSGVIPVIEVATLEGVTRSIAYLGKS